MISQERRDELTARDAAHATRYLNGIEGKSEQGPWYGDTPAARLMQCGDCFGMGPKLVAGHADLLAHFGLDANVDAIMTQAQRLDQRWSQDIDARVRKMNRGRDGGQDDERGEPTTTKPTTKKAEKPAPKPKKAKDVFGSREGSGSYNLNASVLGGATTAAEMVTASGVTLSRCKAHVKWLLDREFIVGDADGFEIAEGFTPAADRPRKSRVVYAIWDINCCSIIRWAGANGMDFDDTAIAIETLGCRGMSDATMKLHHSAGRKGDTRWGEPATLTSSQKKQLRNAAK